ncbi:DUF4102 domain-containing protein [Lichenibacterium minor]|uniref:DUF4102 domain-containing protein n=1 Tax=Lichenibacterium minor TaxID=2316528 RepID=A0A4Q2U0A9_9HYPH|nr:site-specific integrase [Lichenibacterium minor]RYC29712.1 DUF4102 domain-containing protein [Lichenibacterium minor]
MLISHHFVLHGFDPACALLCCAATFLLPRGLDSAEMGKLGSRDLASLGPNSEIWDEGKGAVPGFGARRQRSDAISFVLLYRNADGRSRRFTIGRYGKITPDQARVEAKKLQGRIAIGEDPAEAKQERRKAATVAELCDAYMADSGAGRLLIKGGRSKKASTIAIDRTRFERHIKPLIGGMKVRAVTREDCDRLMHRIAEGESAEIAKASKKARTTGGPGTATRTLNMLGAVFEYAIRKGLREDNPCRGVVRFAEGRRERRLSDAEFVQLGAHLRATTDMWPSALAAVRFVALTGWRKSEVTGLHWGDLDADRRIATLPDTKTGRSVRPLSAAACAILSPLSRSGTYVFPAVRGDTRLTSLGNMFVRLVADAGLPADVTLHVLRHSFASIAADLGYSESTIASLLGHKTGTMTGRYMHMSDPVLLAAADTVAGRIAALMEGET